MEIILKNGDRVKVITENGNIVFDSKEPEFKRGDVVKSNSDDTFGIVDEVRGYADNDKRVILLCFYNKKNDYVKKCDDFCFDIDSMHLATEDEKQQLYDAMQAKGYKWNDKKLCIEKVSPRAKRGDWYLYIDYSYDECRWKAVSSIDFRRRLDDVRYKNNNYFIDDREACKYAHEFNRMLKERTLDNNK